MSCHPKHAEAEPLELPPLERRPLLLEAGRLRAKGLKLRQIAEQMGCSRGTAANYLEEFERHRFRLLQAVAVDQLLDSILQIVAPSSDQESISVKDRLHAARELRLLLASLPQLADHDELQRQQIAQYQARIVAWQEYAEHEEQQRQQQAASSDGPAATNGWTG